VVKHHHDMDPEVDRERGIREGFRTMDQYFVPGKVGSESRLQ
jgi:hypothetical protein